jgi:hypothetical protein
MPKTAANRRLATSVAEPAFPARFGSGTEAALLAGVPIVVEEFLQLLARAVRHFHTYPSTSPLCVDAISTCHMSLSTLEGTERLLFSVTPRALRIGDATFGAGTLIEQELARRLHRACVATVEIDREANPRDLSRFCTDLVAYDSSDAGPSLSETLTEHGVDTIVLGTMQRPEVMQVGMPQAGRCELVVQERHRREQLTTASGPVVHLYPPDKGWIRLDPTAQVGPVSLLDLALLVDDPAKLATMLVRLTGDEPGTATRPEAALEQKFSDVARLFSSFEPRMARLMFAKLAHAVLALDADSRKHLLQRTILPGLLDGRTDGAVLKDFPDVDLAESLSLLLDLETAAPEVLAAALDRLDLPAERRKAVAPLLEERLQARRRATSNAPPRADTTLDQRTKRLIAVNSEHAKNFAEFWAFDLSIDSAAAEALAQVPDIVEKTDLLSARLRCLSHLVRLEPNPDLVETFLRGAAALMADLERGRHWDELASWLLGFRKHAETLREPRPDVAEAISRALAQFYDSGRIGRLVELHDAGGDGRASASSLVDAVGPDISRAFLEVLAKSGTRPIARSLIQLMCEHAALLAPALVTRLEHSQPATVSAVVRVLGFAGPGYEQAIAIHLSSRDEQTVREALRALARIGTAPAAATVAAYICQGSTWARGAAEEALWHFPTGLAHTQLLNLLTRRDFVRNNPQVASRLLDRAVRAHADGLDPALAALTRLRFRFWNPALMRVGLKARALLAR